MKWQVESAEIHSSIQWLKFDKWQRLGTPPLFLSDNTFWSWKVGHPWVSLSSVSGSHWVNSGQSFSFKLTHRFIVRIMRMGNSIWAALSKLGPNPIQLSRADGAMPITEASSRWRNICSLILGVDCGCIGAGQLIKIRGRREQKFNKIKYVQLEISDRGHWVH